MTERWLPAWGLASVAFGGASLIVPLYVVELGGDAFVLGVLFASASFVGVPGALVFGNLADRTGKRRIFVLAAMAVAVVTMVAMPTFDSIGPVIVANALLWLGFAASIPVLTLLVVADEPDSNWTALIASLNRYQGLGWAGGLALGLLVIVGGTTRVDTIVAQRVFFLACAACAGIGFGLALRRLPPDVPPGAEPAPGRLRRRVRSAARFNVRGAAFPFTPGRFDARNLHPGQFAERFTPALATYFVAVFLMYTGFGVFFAPLPAYLTGAGFGSTGIFALYLVLNLGAAAFYGPAATLAGRYDILEVHVGGLATRAVAFPAILVAVGVFSGTILGPGAVTMVFVTIGLTWAVIAVTGATLVSTLSPRRIRGEALGVYGALVAVGGGTGGLLGGVVAASGYAVAFGLAGVLVLGGATVVLHLSRRALGIQAPDTEPL